MDWKIVAVYLGTFIVNTYFSYLLIDSSLQRKNRRVSGRVLFAAFAIYYLARAYAYFFLPLNINLNMLLTICGLLGICMLYRAALSLRLMVPVLSSALGIVCDSGAAIMGSVVLGESLEILFTSSEISVKLFAMHCICVMILYAVSSLLCIRIFKVDDASIELPKAYLFAALIIPLLSCLSVHSTVMAVYSGGTLTISMVCLLCLLLILINIMVLYLYKRLLYEQKDKFEKAVLAQQNRAYASELELMNEASRQIRTLRHDMINHLLAIRALAQERNTAELDIYLRRFWKVLEQTQRHLETGFPDLDSIANYKLKQAEKAGAQVSADVGALNIANGGIDAFDLGCIVGSLLDNALEGLIHSQQKALSLQMRTDCGKLTVQIKSSWSGPEGSGGAYGRSDPGRYEEGLLTVRRTLAKYDGNLTTDARDGCRCLRATLPLGEAV